MGYLAVLMKRREVSTKGFYFPFWWSGIVMSQVSHCLVSEGSSTRETKWQRSGQCPDSWVPQRRSQCPGSLEYHSHRQIPLCPWNISLQQTSWTNRCFCNSTNSKVKKDCAFSQTSSISWSPLVPYLSALPRKLIAWWAPALSIPYWETVKQAFL